MILDERLHRFLRKITNKDLREKVSTLLRDPAFEVDGKKHVGLPLETSPAGMSHHHSYKGGYIEHIVSTANIGLTMCDSVEKIYGGKVERDVVIAGILLHDVFKVLCYSATQDGWYESTRLAEYLDHLSLAVSELVRRNFPLEVIHAVVAHHGSYGPTRPRTVEALICYLADLADSRLNGEILSAASYLLKRAVGQGLPSLNAREALSIVNMKSIKGWDGVKESYERLRSERRIHKT